jgi:hypothetical protein
MRRSLVITDETARHPFLASLPPHVRAGAAPVPARNHWKLTATDLRGFVTAYFACLAAVLVFIL